MKVLMCTDGSRFSESAIEIGGRLLKYGGYNEFAEVFKEEIHKMKKGEKY